MDHSYGQRGYHPFVWTSAQVSQYYTHKSVWMTLKPANIWLVPLNAISWFAADGILVSRQTFSSTKYHQAGNVGQSAKRLSSTLPMQINKNTADLICRCFANKVQPPKACPLLVFGATMQESVAAGLSFARDTDQRNLIL
jgi:hypothetical protein